MKTITALLIALVLIILVAISAAATTYSAPQGSARATFTPAPIVTPAPTWAGATPEPAYPAPDAPRREKRTPLPDNGLRCGHC